jgi:hypothetical protein
MSASWINQVEFFLRQPHRRADPAWRSSLDERTGGGHQDLHRHLNAHPKPFRWTKSADDILASIKRFCLATLKTANQTETSE